MTEGIVIETTKGFVVPSGELIRHGDPRLRPSQDFRFHWCRFNALVGHLNPQRWKTVTLCLYVPDAF